MFCTGKCVNEETKEVCGMFWDIESKDENGVTTTKKGCGLVAIATELINIRERLLGIQQATESRRNNDAKIGIAAVNAIDKGFKRMAKVALVREVPALAVLDDDE